MEGGGVRVAEKQSAESQRRRDKSAEWRHKYIGAERVWRDFT